jgi:hypothetical protein
LPLRGEATKQSYEPEPGNCFLYYSNIFLTEHFYHNINVGEICISGWLPTLLFVLINKTAHQTACG